MVHNFTQKFAENCVDFDGIRFSGFGLLSTSTYFCFAAPAVYQATQPTYDIITKILRLKIEISSNDINVIIQRIGTANKLAKLIRLDDSVRKVLIRFPVVFRMNLQLITDNQQALCNIDNIHALHTDLSSGLCGQSCTAPRPCLQTSPRVVFYEHSR